MNKNTPSPEINEKMLMARQLSGRPYTDRMIDWHNFADLFDARIQEKSDEVFLTYYDGDARIEYTWRQVGEKVYKLANYLRHELLIQPNERVSSVAYNHPETVFIMFACWYVGAVYVPINIGDADERIRFVQENAKVKAVFVMPDLIERYNAIRHNLPQIEHFIQMSGTPQDGYRHLPQELEQQPVSFEGDSAATLETEALLVYTSGTTGTPKGVILEQYNILVDSHCIAEWYGFDKNDRAMLILPIHHVNGIIVTLLTPLYAGAGTVLNRKFSASRYWEIVAREGCTYGSVVPTILSFLSEAYKGLGGQNIGDYFLICGAGPLTVETGKRFEELFGVKVNHGYGLSETTCYSCYLPFDLSQDDYHTWMRDFGYPSIGVPLPCNEMAIHNAEGVSVKPGEKGEIVVRGHNVMKEYYNRPEANAEAFANGWFRTGDEGFYHEDAKGTAFFFITGRLKELIIRGGVNYSPLEIDEVINKIPGVKAGMAVGFENDFYGEEVGAYIVVEEGASMSEKDVLDFCAHHLPFEKRPKAVIFGEDFPVTATGKYQRNKLKHLFADYKTMQYKRCA